MFFQEQSATAAEQGRFMTRVYMWMSTGLAATGITAWYVANSPAMLHAVTFNSGAVLMLGIIQVGLVLGLSWMMRKINALAAIGLFLLYSVVTGLTSSYIFLIYTKQSIAGTFAVTSGMFACLSAIGYTTKRDLSGWGTFLMMALIGIIIAEVGNLFLFHSETFFQISSIVTVLLFSAFTAYDVQQIKNMNVLGNEDTEEDTKEAIFGALKLYLDFINLFFRLLYLTGKRR